MGKSCWNYQPADTLCFTFIIVYMLYPATGITLSPCGFDNIMEVEESRSNNSVNCSGIPSDYIVTWRVTLPGRVNPVNVGTCLAGSTTCGDFSSIGYLATRQSADTSVMTINPNANPNFVRNGTLECQATKSGQIETESCKLDITFVPSNVTCTVQSVMSASDMTVAGRCDISKSLSQLRRYSCQWFIKQESAPETPFDQPVAIHTTSITDVSPTNSTYVIGFCNVTMTWPSENTSYRVIVSPGYVSVYAGNISGTSTSSHPGCGLFCLLLLLLFLLLPLPIPPPWPGYPIYVALCRIPNQGSSTGSPQPDNWHPHYICSRRTNNVYFSACVVTNDGRAVLIWSRSPTTGRFVCYGTETIPGTNSNNVSAASGAANNGNQQTSQKEKNKHTGTDGSNNVSAASGAANNGNQQTSQKEKNKHTGTDGSPRKPRHPDAPVELTTVPTSSPPQAATVHGDNQASGTPHGDHQASGTPRLRPLPEPSRMTSVERNSTAETSNINGLDKHSKLPPIKPDNRP